MDNMEFRKESMTTARIIGFKYVVIGLVSFAVVSLLLGAINAYNSTLGIAVAIGPMSGMVMLASKEACRAGRQESGKS